MRIGVQLSQTTHQADRASVKACAVAADTLGYHSVWVFDRLLAPLEPRTPYPSSVEGRLPDEHRAVLDPFATLAFAAAVTERVRLGTSVLVAPFYRPLTLARALAGIDVLSEGRLTIGLGLGWSVDEFDALGLPMSGRAAAEEEILDVLDAVWSGVPQAYRGPTVDLVASEIGPRPVQRPRPPVLLAAYTPAGLDRVARRADGWTPAGLPLAALAPMWVQVREAAAGYGRDPEPLELVVRANIELTDRPLGEHRPTYHGSVAQVVEDLVATRRAGAHEVVLAVGGPLELDATLDAYAELAAGLEVVSAHR